MESKLNELFEAMWHKYDQTCFDAHRIHKLLTERGEEIENDHIAIRRFNTECMNIEVIANIFKEYGYEEKGQYYFEEKKLNAKHYELEGYPKIFISELILEEFSQELQDIVHRKITGIEVDRLNFLYNGVPLSYETLH